MKDMLTKNDLRQIGELMEEKLDQKLGEVLEVVNSGFSGVQEQLCGMQQEAQSLKQDISGLNQKVTRMETTMVTKDYLDDKLADLRGEFMLKQKV